MSGFDWDYGPHRNAPGDPRNADEPDRYQWEDDNGYADVLTAEQIDSILYELLYFNPDEARKMANKMMDEAFAEYLDASKRQDEEDRAADRAADRWAA